MDIFSLHILHQRNRRQKFHWFKTWGWVSSPSASETHLEMEVIGSLRQKEKETPNTLSSRILRVLQKVLSVLYFLFQLDFTLHNQRVNYPKESRSVISPRALSGELMLQSLLGPISTTILKRTGNVMPSLVTWVTFQGKDNTWLVHWASWQSFPAFFKGISQDIQEYLPVTGLKTKHRFGGFSIASSKKQ